MIVSKEKYEKSLRVVDQLLVGRSLDSLSDDEKVQLEFHTDIVEAYEKEYYPIELPSLVDVIKLRMFEMNLKQKDLANLLEVSATLISEYLKGRRDITLDVAKKIHKKLDIDADIILQ
ncbi:type II toxin-antitoxin system HigA family antitoxin [Prolixibacter sp. NT017]|uniref:helix-turn-helix domain-containing protein n=1 Tax=Prolixibacter sp. NT017 TaxID=2652390 RepID=UPI00127B9187|nr:helix-turn-helix domain-containing protein [Prolixibacter sp. NT017]GET25834.1 transcriptional regulator [Prolixibacter sp. NT017]